MRFVEFTSGLQTFVSKEEEDLVEEINKNGSMNKKDLSERQQVLARRLAEKSILIRQKHNDNIQYKLSSNAIT
jgi:hypothetical protein